MKNSLLLFGAIVAFLGGFMLSGYALYVGLVRPPSEEEAVEALPMEAPSSLAKLPPPAPPPVTSTGGIDPVRIEIPKIGVSAPIEAVGIGRSGNMAVPDSYERVGWYRRGYRPGEPGSAVMAGHFDNGFGFASVFNGLPKLEGGDKVIIHGSRGERLTFEVTDDDVYEARTKDTAAVFAAADEPKLNLITCDGVWVASEESYDKRLVIFTRLVSRENT